VLVGGGTEGRWWRWVAAPPGGGAAERSGVITLTLSGAYRSYDLIPATRRGAIMTAIAPAPVAAQVSIRLISILSKWSTDLANQLRASSTNSRVPGRSAKWLYNRSIRDSIWMKKPYVFAFGLHFVGERLVRGGDAEEGSESCMPDAPTIEAEDEFIEVGSEVLAAQPVVDAQSPDLEVGEYPVDPGQDDMGSHLADDMGIVGGAGISRPTIGLGGGAGAEVGGEEGVEADCRVIGDLAQADAAGAEAAVHNLDGAEDQHFALIGFVRRLP